MESSFWLNLFYLTIGLLLLFRWILDLKSNLSKNPNPNALAGATICSRGIILVGVLGVMVILVFETFGEIIYKIDDQQSYLVWHSLFPLLAAAVIEELVFRGYIFINNRGQSILFGSCCCASILFALLHDHIWKWEDGEINFYFTEKSFFTTGFLLINSIWFYFLRFCKWNPHRSLLPCFIAHASSNLGVYFIKLFQGFIH